MSVEIKPGIALDRAVAEALGFTVFARSPDINRPIQTLLVTPREWDKLRGVEHTTCEGDLACVPFSPSTDLNAAFAAAEATGLFSETFWRTLGMDELGETWDVFEQDGCVKRSIIGECPTPALAISMAILELKKIRSKE